MALGGVRPGAGRPKGSKNKPKPEKAATRGKAAKTAPRKAAAQAKRSERTERAALRDAGLPTVPPEFATAREFALHCLNNPAVEMDLKVDLAKVMMKLDEGGNPAGVAARRVAQHALTASAGPRLGKKELAARAAEDVASGGDESWGDLLKPGYQAPN